MFVCVSMALKCKRPLLLGHSTPSGVTPWTTVSLQCVHVASWLLGVTWVQGQCAYWTSANLPVTLVQQMRPCIGGLAQLVILYISVSEQGRDRSTLYCPWCIAPIDNQKVNGKGKCLMFNLSQSPIPALGFWKNPMSWFFYCVSPPSSHFPSLTMTSFARIPLPALLCEPPCVCLHAQVLFIKVPSHCCMWDHTLLHYSLVPRPHPSKEAQWISSANSMSFVKLGLVRISL